MNAAAPSAQSRDDLAETVTYAAIADKPHHVSVLISLRPAEAVPEVRSSQVAVPQRLLDACLCVRGFAVPLPCNQGVTPQVISFGRSERRDEFSKEMPHLKGSWARFSGCFRPPSFRCDPFPDAIRFFKEFPSDEQRLNATQIPKPGILELVLPFEAGALDERALEQRASKVAVLEYGVGEVGLAERNPGEIAFLEADAHEAASLEDYSGALKKIPFGASQH